MKVLHVLHGLLTGFLLLTVLGLVVDRRERIDQQAQVNEGLRQAYLRHGENLDGLVELSQMQVQTSKKLLQRVEQLERQRN